MLLIALSTTLTCSWRSMIPIWRTAVHQSIFMISSLNSLVELTRTATVSVYVTNVIVHAIANVSPVRSVEITSLAYSGGCVPNVDHARTGKIYCLVFIWPGGILRLPEPERGGIWTGRRVCMFQRNIPSSPYGNPMSWSAAFLKN